MTEETTVEEPIETPIETPEVETGEVETPEVGTEEPTPSEDEAKKGGIQKRINELTREKYEAKQEAELIRQQLNELQAAQQKQQIENNSQPPRLEDYTDDQSYYQAVQLWNQSQVEAIQKAQQESLQQQQAVEQQIKAQQALQAKMQAAVVKHPDFLMKINDPSLPSLQNINPAAFQAVVESDQFGEVAYYLANNPAELYNFGNLTPLQAVKEIAKLEIRLGSKPPSKTIPISPPSEVGGTASTTIDEDKLSTAEWIAMRNKKLQR
jgi:hypothetical protein